MYSYIDTDLFLTMANEKRSLFKRTEKYELQTAKFYSLCRGRVTIHLKFKNCTLFFLSLLIYTLILCVMCKKYTHFL